MIKFWFEPAVCVFSRNTSNQLQNFGGYWYQYTRQFEKIRKTVYNREDWKKS